MQISASENLILRTWLKTHINGEWSCEYETTRFHQHHEIRWVCNDLLQNSSSVLWTPAPAVLWIDKLTHLAAKPFLYGELLPGKMKLMKVVRERTPSHPQRPRAVCVWFWQCKGNLRTVILLNDIRNTVTASMILNKNTVSNSRNLVTLNCFAICWYRAVITTSSCSGPRTFRMWRT